MKLKCVNPLPFSLGGERIGLDSFTHNVLSVLGLTLILTAHLQYLMSFLRTKEI